MKRQRTLPQVGGVVSSVGCAFVRGEPGIHNHGTHKVSHRRAAATAVIMDFGPGALRRPGMTAIAAPRCASDGRVIHRRHEHDRRAAETIRRRPGLGSAANVIITALRLDHQRRQRAEVAIAERQSSEEAVHARRQHHGAQPGICEMRAGPDHGHRRRARRHDCGGDLIGGAFHGDRRIVRDRGVGRERRGAQRGDTRRRGGGCVCTAALIGIGERKVGRADRTGGVGTRRLRLVAEVLRRRPADWLLRRAGPANSRARR